MAISDIVSLMYIIFIDILYILIYFVHKKPLPVSMKCVRHGDLGNEVQQVQGTHNQMRNIQCQLKHQNYILTAPWPRETM